MARIELTENFGPEVIDSWDSSTSGNPVDNYGPIVNVRLYTLHSYQVLHPGGGSNVTFSILGSNYTDPTTGLASPNFSDHWSVLHSEVIPTGTNIAYSDVWNFKYATIHFSGASSVNIKVLEKHNV
jgi:hypothetical protein